MKYRLIVPTLVGAAAAAVAVASLTGTHAVPSAASAPQTRHYTANESGAYQSAHNVGFNVHDTNMYPSIINDLPGNDQALVYADGGKCPSTSLPPDFTSFVKSQADNPKVYGYYLTDEPKSGCVDGVRAMADYIHKHAKGQKAFIVLDDVEVYGEYAPSNSHVDLVGLDPYPCNHQDGCDFSKIGTKVGKARDAGIPQSAIVPVYQGFGNDYYAPPTAKQLREILHAWQQAVPSPAMDYTYSWSCQDGSLTDCVQDRNDWQKVLSDYFDTASSGQTKTPTPSPSKSPKPSQSPSPSQSQSPSPTSSPSSSPTDEDATRLQCPVVDDPSVGDTVTCRFVQN